MTKYAAVFVLAATVLLATSVSLAQATTQPGQTAVTAGTSMDFPHVGIALTTPAGYQGQTVTQPFDVMRSVLRENGQPVQAVTLTVLPLGDPNATVDELADAMVAALRQNLAVRNLGVLSQAPMKVADSPGAARFLSYTFRGEETVAASVVFCRPLGEPAEAGSPERPGRLQVVITVEAAAARKAEVLPALGEVVRSVRLLTVVRPIDIAFKESGRFVEAPDGSYSIHLPHGWFAPISNVGVAVAQTDYTLDGQPGLGAQALVSPWPAGMTLQQHADHCIQIATQAASQQGMEGQVISQGPSRLGTVEGYQLVFEQRLPLATSAPASAPATAAVAATAPTSILPTGQGSTEQANVVIVQRTVMLPTAAANSDTSPPRPQGLSLVLICVNARPAAAEAVMEKLAGGMTIRAAAQAASAPVATAPAPTTIAVEPVAPAATEPAYR
jgi:hypothetical protein